MVETLGYREAAMLFAKNPAVCTPSGPERCDYRDNDCNGVIDEGCDDCAAGEVCDGIDNTCDGNIDEGCAECVVNGETCSTDEDCCFGVCDGGTCGSECRPQAPTEASRPRSPSSAPTRALACPTLAVL